MPFPWLPGMRMTATRMNARNRLLVEQEQDQTSNSDTWLDSQITFTPEAGAVYEYSLYIAYSTSGNAEGGSTADFRWRWSASGADFASFTQAVAPPATGTFNAPQQVIFRRPGNATARVAGGPNNLETFWSAYDVGTILVATSAPITMQWSQNTTTASEDTILRGGSTNTRLLYQRIG